MIKQRAKDKKNGKREKKKGRRKVGKVKEEETMQRYEHQARMLVVFIENGVESTTQF